MQTAWLNRVVLSCCLHYKLMLAIGISLPKDRCGGGFRYMVSAERCVDDQGLMS